jgi:serine/threonine protein phosphatase PrpC
VASGRFIHVTEIVGRQGVGQDRAIARTTGDGVLIVLADGAGGTGGGAEAAQAVVDKVMASAASGSSWSHVLETIDQDMARRCGGQSTAIVISVTPAGLEGASVGDSGAWVIRGTEIEDLSARQVRKPLVGAGCTPSAIHGGTLGEGTLLVASDGLLKYAKPSDIARIAGGADLQEVARALIDLVRLRSGQLQDDVSIVLCREQH